MVTEAVGLEIPEWVIAEHEAAQEAQKTQEARAAEHRKARAAFVSDLMVGLLDDLLPGWRERMTLEFTPSGVWEVLYEYCARSEMAPRLHVGPLTCTVVADSENDLTLLVSDGASPDWRDAWCSLNRSHTPEENWRVLGTALYAAFGRIAEASETSGWTDDTEDLNK